MFKKLSLTALSAVLILPLNHEASGMDHPGMLAMKPEPGIIRPAHRVVNPAITINQMQTMFGNKDTKINKNGGKQNCVDCAISFYNWLDKETISPERVKRRKSTQNMVCDDDGEFAELINELDNEKLDIKEVTIDLVDGSTTPFKAKFNPVVIKSEDRFTTLEKYLEQIPLKTTLDRSTRFRVGLLYFINKTPKNTGHMINFYNCIENSEIKTYIVDPQHGSIKSLSDFIEDYKFLNHGYVWYDKGENTAGIEFRNNFIKIEDGTVLPCQAPINRDRDEAMDVERDNSLLFQTDLEASELSIMDIEEDRTSTKRPREENSDSDEPVAKKRKIKKEKSQAEEERKAKKREAARLRMTKKRENETPAEREERLETMRLRLAKKRENETTADREKRLEAARIQSSKMRANETLAEREKRLEAEHLRYVKMLANETEADREKRLEAMRLRKAKRQAEMKEGKSQPKKKRKASSDDENPSPAKKRKKK